MKGKRLIKVEVRKDLCSIQSIMEQFICFKRAQGLAERTIKDYQTTFKLFLSFFEAQEIRLENIRDKILNLFSKLSNLAPATFNNPYSYLNSFFNWSVNENYLDENPLKSLGLKKKKDEGRIRCIEVAYIKALIDKIDLKTYTGLRDYVIVLLMLDCGIRPCEAFKIEVNDIDFKSGILRIRKEIAKTRTERILPLSMTMVNLLQRIIQVKPSDWNNNLVFCKCDGLPMHVVMYDKRLAYYSQKAGVKVTPYDLRHTFAIMYLRNNGNAFTLQKTMGHADLSMTKRYLGLSLNDLKEQHQKASPLQNIVKRNTRVQKLFR